MKKKNENNFFKKVNFDGLVKELEKRMDVKNLVIEGGIVLDRLEQKYIQFESNNLASQAGIQSGIYKELVITNFGGTEREDGTYWVPVHFSFEYKDGGSNGASLFNAQYNPNNPTEWIVLY